MNRLTPYEIDAGQRAWYSEPPIPHLERRRSGGMPVEVDWFECPNCGQRLDYRNGDDRWLEGYAASAEPDSAKCDACAYHWAE